MRKRRQEEHENHERWLVSYADFITLLFAFFVVMYSISSINEGKYRVLSDALVAAFRSPSKSLQPIEIGKLAKSPVSSPIELPYEFRKKSLHRVRQLRPVEAPPAFGVIGNRRGTGSTAVKVIASEIRRAVKELIDKNLITVHQGKTWLEIEIKASILFPSGSAAVNDKALPVLRRIAKVLAPHPNPINVEGHTDDQPIRSLIYPSNWELSAARAASVVELFVEYGIAPQRMAAVGYGQYRPIADNDTPEGRAKNRRVTLTVLATRQTTPAEPAHVQTPAHSAPKVSSALSPIPSPIKLPPRAKTAPPASKQVAPAIPSSQTSGADAAHSAGNNTEHKSASSGRIAPLLPGRSTMGTLSPIRPPIKLPPLPGVGDAGQ